MKIDFSDFLYFIPAHGDADPIILDSPAIQVGHQANYKFDPSENEIGSVIKITSEIIVPLYHIDKNIVFSGYTIYVIPFEQPNLPEDQLTEIDSSVYTEFLYQHLARQTAYIFQRTLKDYPQTKGIMIATSTICRLYKLQSSSTLTKI